MAPSRKSSKKRSAKSENKNYQDKTLESMTKSELEVYAKRLMEMVDAERSEKSVLRLEKSLMAQLLESAQTNSAASDDHFLAIEAKFQTLSESKAKELLVYRQKVKHLIYEQYERWCKLKAEVTLEKEVQARSFEASLSALRAEKATLKTRAEERELAHQHFIKETGLTHSRKIEECQAQYTSVVRALESKNELMLRRLMDHFSLKTKRDCLELEEAKNAQTAELTHIHDTHFTEIKNYFNDITLNNLSLINSLKDQIESMTAKEERLEKQIAELTSANRELASPLAAARQQLADNRKKLANWTHLKRSLVSEERKSGQLAASVSDLNFEVEMLRQKLEQVEGEKRTYRAELKTIAKQRNLEESISDSLLEKENSHLKERVAFLTNLQHEIEENRNESINNSKIKTFESLVAKKDKHIKELTRKLKEAKKELTEHAETGLIVNGQRRANQVK